MLYQTQETRCNRTNFTDGGRFKELKMLHECELWKDPDNSQHKGFGEDLYVEERQGKDPVEPAPRPSWVCNPTKSRPSPANINWALPTTRHRARCCRDQGKEEGTHPLKVSGGQGNGRAHTTATHWEQLKLEPRTVSGPTARSGGHDDSCWNWKDTRKT